jgi:hypothetical protein
MYAIPDEVGGQGVTIAKRAISLLADLFKEES